MARWHGTLPGVHHGKTTGAARTLGHARLSDAVGLDEAVNQTAVPQINQLLVEARALVVSLGRLSEAIERQPTQLLFGDRREGYSPQ